MTFNDLVAARMEERALINRWPMKPEVRAKAIERILGILDDPDAKPRAITAATKVLAALEKQNQEDEHLILKLQAERKAASTFTIHGEVAHDMDDGDARRTIVHRAAQALGIDLSAVPYDLPTEEAMGAECVSGSEERHASPVGGNSEQGDVDTSETP